MSETSEHNERRKANEGDSRSASEQRERRKAQYHILPWEGIRLAAELMTQSNNPDKHQDAKWKRMTPEEHIDALMRHLNAWLTKNAVDSESGMSHLVHVAVRALMAAEMERRINTSEEGPFYEDSSGILHGLKDAFPWVDFKLYPKRLHTGED
jgi:hypothetical protein